MTRGSLVRLIAAAAVFVALASAARPQDAGPPIVVLISFDGWRWDYTDKFDVPSLRALAARGVRVREMVPAFPALTFPNHYTLVTGLYPEHHGIVANIMIDPRMPDRFTMSAETMRDPRWWGGEPIWVTAIRQGHRAATMFWPGSEVAIKGVLPTYWRKFDSKVSVEARTRQTIDWLGLPEAERPSVVTLYQELTDHAGHDFGPDSPQAARAAADLDRSLGVLIDAIRRLGLAGRTTVVVVSDHGMTALAPDRVIWLDDYLDLAEVNVTEWEGLLQLKPKVETTANVARIYDRLRSAHPRLQVFTRDQLPGRLRHGDNPRNAPIVAMPDLGWVVTTRERRLTGHDDDWSPQRGAHGFDPQYRDMHALFVAAGPRVVPGLVVPTMDNVHVYEFLCAAAGLTPAPNDGDAAVTRAFLR